MPDTKALLEALAACDMLPLWDRYMTLLRRGPAASDEPIYWSWRDLRR